MNDKNRELRARAEEYRDLYRLGQCTREEAEENIMPYINAVNKKSIELAKKYKQKARKVSFANFIR